MHLKSFVLKHQTFTIQISLHKKMQNFNVKYVQYFFLIPNQLPNSIPIIKNQYCAKTLKTIS